MSIIVKDLVKVYRLGHVEIRALRGLSLTIEKGRMVALIGPSGSGKTTLLNIIGGLETASSGSVNVFGKEVTTLGAADLVEFRRQTVGHIFQTLNLIPTLTAAENVELSMIALGKPKTERTKLVEELIGIVGLSDRMNHKQGELSGGEQQRVAIAAALANNPPLILADEPTGELDTVNARIVIDYLSKVNKEMGKTILMVTHDPAAARAASRILRIQDGVINRDVEPLGLEAAAPETYSDTLMRRVTEIDSQINQIEADFKRGDLSGDEYVTRRTSLMQTKTVLVEELHRLGQVH